MSDNPLHRLPASPALGPQRPSLSPATSRPRAVPSQDDFVGPHELATRDYPWSHQNPAPVIPTLWPSQSSADDNPFQVQPSPAGVNPSSSPIQPSPAGVSHRMNSLDIHQIASLGHAGPAPAGHSRTGPPLPRLGLQPELARPHTMMLPPGLPQSNSPYADPVGPLTNEPVSVHEDVAPQRPSRIPLEGESHHFYVFNVTTDLEALDLLQEIKTKKYRTTIGPFLTDLNTKGHFYIGFAELDEAKHASRWLQSLGWVVNAIPVDDFNDATRLAFPTPADLNDTVRARVYCGPQSPIDASNVAHIVIPVLNLVGTVDRAWSLQAGQPDDPSVVRFYEVLVRYSNIDHTLNAIRALNGVRTDELVLEVMPCKENSHFATSAQARHEFEASTKGKGSNRKGSSRRGTKSGRRPPVTPKAFEPQASPARGEPDYTINLEEVVYGIDTRTSVMCRNLPNVMTWRELKSILDLSSVGRYNYLYLRINFGDNQNVGYAFVNFETAADIIPFVRARAGQTWPGFEQFTERIAEITYADVQGYGTLVERFRNSPVILNHPDNRPKLFHTSGRRAGGEAAFPPVNNFYTLAMGVFRSQLEPGLHRNETPRTSRTGAAPRTPARQLAPTEDDQANNEVGIQSRTPGSGSASRQLSWPAKDRHARN